MAIYRPSGPTIADFLRSKSPIRFIEGPIESGKSTACAMAIYVGICTMPRMRDGKRRSRWLVTRNSYPDLRGSTVETFLNWFKPEVYGKFRDTEPYTFSMKFRDAEAEIVFESFLDDRDDTIRSLRSKEFTGAWINECQFFPRRLVFEIASRTGRYPRRIDLAHVLTPGEGLTQFLVADNNAPFTDDHWILRMRGDVPLPLDMPLEEAMQFIKPAGVQFFRQAPALLEIMTPDGQNVRGYEVSPEAENVEHMRDGARSTVEMDRLEREAKALGQTPPRPHRYIELTGGKTKDEIDRDLLGRVVRVKVGAPATPQYRRERHVCREAVEPFDGAGIVIGADHGLTPACVFLQNIAGSWIVFDELTATNTTTDEFAPQVRQVIAARFPWVIEGRGGYAAWGDPQGGWRGGSTDSRTPFQIYNAHGVAMRPPALKDKPQLRLETIRRLLATEHNGRPRLMVHPRCKRLIAALGGGAQIRRVKTADGLKLVEDIVKNADSHVFEATCYALWGGGEAREIIQPAGVQKARIQNAAPKKRRLFTVGRRFSR